MSLELRQNLQLSQQLVMTPLLQQAIKLLQLSRLELIETVQQELETNPVLEEVVGDTDAVFDLGMGPETEGSSDNMRSDMDLSDWESYVREYNPRDIDLPPEDKEFPSYEATAATTPDLKEHLLWQLGMTRLSERQKEIGVFIIGELNEDGFLELTVDEIAQELGAPKEEVEEVLGTIQHFDPVGVAARDLRETLLIQARFHGYQGTLVETLLANHLKELGEKRYEELTRKLNISLEELSKALHIIQTLDPRPSRNYSNERPHYITPDVYVIKVGDNYEIIVNEDGMPRLRINSFYRDILNEKERLSEVERNFIKEKLRNASWLIKSIHQRQKTLYKVTESIFKFQREFLDYGVAHLKPLILKQVAEDINMHESTVSRVTSNKYVHTPWGIFELKYFFNTSISGLSGDSVSSERVKELIKNIIKTEDKRRPYSDQEIADMLLKHDIKIARRTVAKYRESLGISPSKQRVQIL